MRGFGGLTEARDSVMASLGLSLPPWAIPAVFVLLFLGLFPHIRQNQRTHKARILIRERSESGGSASSEFHSQLLELANGHPVTLGVIVHEAHKYGLLNLAKTALHALKNAGGKPGELQRLHRLLYGPPPVHPEGEYAAIETLIQQKLFSLATERVNKALRHWPDDRQLTILADRIPSEE
jgi:hypothetical protein